MGRANQCRCEQRSLVMKGAEMNKTILLSAAVLLMASLAACGSTGGATSEGGGGLTDSYEGALSVPEQLILGTLKLEETEYAVSSDQAAELLFLWQAYLSMIQSDTAAEAEIDALIDQIQETMTADQIAAIAAMELTQDHVATLVQEMGIIGPGGATPEGATGNSSGESFIIEGRGLPEGGAPPGGQFQGGGPSGGQMPGGAVVMGEGAGQNLSQDQIATLQAERGTGGGRANRPGMFLLNPLLQFLGERAEQ